MGFSPPVPRGGADARPLDESHSCSHDKRVMRSSPFLSLFPPHPLSPCSVRCSFPSVARDAQMQRGVECSEIKIIATATRREAFSSLRVFALTQSCIRDNERPTKIASDRIDSKMRTRCWIRRICTMSGLLLFWIFYFYPKCINFIEFSFNVKWMLLVIDVRIFDVESGCSVRWKYSWQRCFNYRIIVNEIVTNVLTQRND